MNSSTIARDARLDLSFERNVDVSCAQVWAAWTTPELLTQWFTPAPWKTTACEIDLRPGGRFHVVMRGPEGPEISNTGCYLEVVPERRLVWTSALTPGFRPAVAKDAVPGSFAFTAVVELEPEGSGTRYRATVIHGDEEARARHEAMGFEQGWGMALDQLVELMRLNGRPVVREED